MAEASTANGEKPGGDPVRLNVKNLSPSCFEEELRKLFEEFGTLTEAQVKMNPDGSSKCMGFVCFATMEEAEKAVAEMNGKVLEERTLSVKIVEKQAAKGEGKGKGKGKHKVQQMHQNPYWYGPDPMAMGYPAAFYEYGMTNPYGYDLGAIYNAMAPGAHMFNGFSMAMPQHPKAVDPNAILALQQAQFFALQSQAPLKEPKGKSKGKGKGKGKESKGKERESQREETPAAEAPPPDKEFVGFLKSVSGKNGYGFIVCSEIQQTFQRDVWVDSSLLPEGVDPDEKPQLKFTVTLSNKGHPQAKNVELA